MNEQEFARRFWKKKWRDWRKEHPDEFTVSTEVMAAWREELRNATQNSIEDEPE